MGILMRLAGRVLRMAAPLPDHNPIKDDTRAECASRVLPSIPDKEANRQDSTKTKRRGENTNSPLAAHAGEGRGWQRGKVVADL